MASFKGLTLKGYKVVGADHEGFGLKSGNLYLGKKKLGAVTDDSWGGPMNFSFDSSILKEHIAAYNEFRPCPWGEWDADCLVGFLDKINDLEKTFKKTSYIGPRTLVYFTDGLNAASCLFKNTKTTTVDSIKKSKAYKENLEEFVKSITHKVGQIQTYFFQSEADFNI